MSKTIAIFGAGTGLGLSVARRFGREGYRVALVGRRKKALDSLVADLSTDGIDSTAFPADLQLTARIPALISAITERYGPIDVIQYAPIAGAPFIPAADLTPESMQDLLTLHLLTPIQIVRVVLPGMIERGFGGIFIGQGATAVNAAPFASGLGPAMAAARNYVHSLHGEVADKGVYAGALIVDAMIAGSAIHQAIASGELTLNLPEGFVNPTVDPADLADGLWDLLTKRDRVELTYHGAGPASGS
jgi:short-subunit dehydrogenase